MSEKNIFTTQHKEYYDRHSITIGMFVKIQIPQNYPSLLRRFAPCFFKRREARRRRRDTISVKGPRSVVCWHGGGVQIIIINNDKKKYKRMKI